jgi:hypothetical protein
VAIAHRHAVTQARKTEKLGWWHGVRAEWRMVFDLLEPGTAPAACQRRRRNGRRSAGRPAISMHLPGEAGVRGETDAAATQGKRPSQGVAMGGPERPPVG